MGDMADDARDLAEADWLHRSEGFPESVALAIWTGAGYDFCPVCEGSARAAQRGPCDRCEGRGWVEVQT